VTETITPAERRVAIALLVTILEHADGDLAREIVGESVQCLLRRWSNGRPEGAVGGVRIAPLTYAGAWRPAGRAGTEPGLAPS